MKLKSQARSISGAGGKGVINSASHEGTSEDPNSLRGVFKGSGSLDKGFEGCKSPEGASETENKTWCSIRNQDHGYEGSAESSSFSIIYEP